MKNRTVGASSTGATIPGALGTMIGDDVVGGPAPAPKRRGANDTPLTGAPSDCPMRDGAPSTDMTLGHCGVYGDEEKRK
jgi:hypothetical protein